MIGGPTTLLSKNEDEAVERRSEIQSCHFQVNPTAVSTSIKYSQDIESKALAISIFICRVGFFPVQAEGSVFDK